MALIVRKAEDTVTVRDLDLSEVPESDRSEDVTYTLRTLTLAKNRELGQKYVRQEFNKRTHRKEDVPLTSDQYAAFQDDLFDYVVQDWSGVIDADTRLPLACTREHKLLLDPVRRVALMNLAGTNQAQAVAAASFREPA